LHPTSAWEQYKAQCCLVNKEENEHNGKERNGGEPDVEYGLYEGDQLPVNERIAN